MWAGCADDEQSERQRMNCVFQDLFGELLGLLLLGFSCFYSCSFYYLLFMLGGLWL